MEKEENLKQDNPSSESLNESNDVEKQSDEDQIKQNDVEEKEELSPEEKIKEL